MKRALTAIVFHVDTLIRILRVRGILRAQLTRGP